MGSPISLKQLITVVFCPPWLSFTKIYVGILHFSLYSSTEHHGLGLTVMLYT